MLFWLLCDVWCLPVVLGLITCLGFVSCCWFVVYVCMVAHRGSAWFCFVCLVCFRLFVGLVLV